MIAAARARLERSPLGRAFLVVATIAVCGVLPAFVLGVVVVDLAGGDAGWPFREAFLGAADAILDGDSPYPDEDDPSFLEGTAYVYPPLVAFLVMPFLLVGEAVAVTGFALLLIAAVAATLALLGVRDWRCYGIAFLWPGVLSAIHVENITVLLGLAAALVWRFRDHPSGAVALGVSGALKPVLWPLGAWLLGARRFSATALAAAVAVVVALGSWAAIGFDGLRDYPDLLRRLGDAMDEWGYSVFALALDLGAGETLAKALWLALAGGLLAASYVVTRRGDATRGFVLAVAAAIACSPVVWLHYFALLLVPVAIAQPTLGVAWLAPFLMYGSEEIQNGTPFQTGLTLFAAALTIAVALRVAPRRPAEPVEEPRPVAYDGARRITVTRSSA